MAQDKKTCIIVGAGGGLSASLARMFAAEDMSIVLAARDIQKLDGLKEELNCELVQCDATNIDQVKKLFAFTDQISEQPSIVIYNPSARIRGDITSLDPVQTKLAIETTCFGACPQELESILVGPIPLGLNKIVFQVRAFYAASPRARCLPACPAL